LTIAILIGEVPETRALLAEAEPAESLPNAPAATAPPVATAPPAPSSATPGVQRAPAAASAIPAERAPPLATKHGPEHAHDAPASGFVSAFVTVGTGLDSGGARRGGGLWAARSLAPLPLWIPVSVAYTWRPREDSLKVDFLTLRAGVGNVWKLVGRRVELEAEAFVALEQLTATATHPTSGRQDSEQRWAPLLGIGVGPIFRVFPPLCVALEARFGKSLRSFTVYNAGPAVAHTTSWDAALEVGPLLTFR